MLTRDDTHDVDTGAHQGPMPAGETVVEARAREAGMSPHRRTAIVVGVLFIAGDVAGVLNVAFTSGLFKEPDYLTRIAAHQNRLVIGALCGLAMGFLLAMIPVVMYPIFRRYNRPLAMGYVVFRGAIETVTYIAGAATSLLLVALSRDYVRAGSPDTPQFGTVGQLLLKAQKSISPDMTTIVFSLSVFMFCSLFYQSRLIPRWLSVWGLAGAVLYLAVALFDLFRVSAGFLYAPLAVQEIVLAVWLIVKGFDFTASQAPPALSGGAT
jgi:hypothetical protein